MVMRKCKKNRSRTNASVCDSDLTVTRLYCVNCDTTIEGHFTTEHTPFGHLTPEQMQFLLTFVRCEGRLNRMEDEMNLSYPTLRSRLNEIVRALGYEPGKEEAPIHSRRKTAVTSSNSLIAARSPGKKPRHGCVARKSLNLALLKLRR
jgi:hypothetical protein